MTPSRSPRHPLLAALLACALCAVAGSAAAALYKWTDANGRVVYSDQPPTGNVKYEVVTGAPPPSNPNAAKELAGKEVDFKKRQTEAAAAQTKADGERVAQAKKQETCERARSNIRQLGAEQIQLVRHNEKGEIIVLDEATRRRERAEIEAWVKANCG